VDLVNFSEKIARFVKIKINAKEIKQSKVPKIDKKLLDHLEKA
jgi:hypothetical protein